MLLSAKPDKKGEISLLMRLGTFKPEQSLFMRVSGKDYLLASSKLVEGGDEFDRAKFAIKQLT